MSELKPGDLVETDGLIAVVVRVEGEVPEDHVTLWFGEPQGKRKSEGGKGSLTPVIWTVPASYCTLAKKPDARH